MDYFSAKDRDMLIALSDNSRATLTELSKLTGLSRITVKKRLDYLTEKLQIRFVLEVDESRLQSFEKHVIFVKFQKAPKTETLRKFFQNDKYAQNVYAVDGDLDLVVYAAARSGIEYIVWETKLASELSEYGVSIRPSEYVTSHFGFMPLNDVFIDAIGTDNKIDDRDKEILGLLNQNSRMSYSELAEKTGMNEHTIRYRVFSIRKLGIIRRFTIAVQKPPEGHVGIMYFINYIFTKSTTSEGFAHSRRIFFNSDLEKPLLNSFQFIAPMSGSFRSLGMALFPSRADALKRTVESLKDVFKKDRPEIKYGIIKAVLKGSFPFRNLDIKENYKIIEWNGTKDTL